MARESAAAVKELATGQLFWRVLNHRMLGARPMRGAVEQHLQEAVTASVLAGHPGSGRLVTDSAANRLRLVGYNPQLR